MKKKFILVGLIVMMLIAGLFTFTGCGDKEESKNKAETSSKESENSDNSSTITVEDSNKKGHTVTFDNTNGDFQLDEEYSSVLSSVVLQNNKLGVELTMFVSEWTKTDYESYKLDMIKEYTWNGMKGFTFDDHSSSAVFFIELVDDGDRYILLKGDLSTIELDSTINAEEVFDSKDIQDFLGTIQYKN